MVGFCSEFESPQRRYHPRVLHSETSWFSGADRCRQRKEADYQGNSDGGLEMHRNKHHLFKGLNVNNVLEYRSLPISCFECWDPGSRSLGASNAITHSIAFLNPEPFNPKAPGPKPTGLKPVNPQPRKPPNPKLCKA